MKVWFMFVLLCVCVCFCTEHQNTHSTSKLRTFLGNGRLFLWFKDVALGLGRELGLGFRG